MAKKRPTFSFPELEQRGRNAILRSADEVRAEEALLEAAEPDDSSEQAASSGQPLLPSTQERGSSAPRRGQRDPDEASTYARVRARKDVGRALLVEQLRQELLTKQHLTSYTFRFRPEELERLDRLVAELNRSRTTKLSKNDLVRLALSWLLSDYEDQDHDGLLMEVIGRE